MPTVIKLKGLSQNPPLAIQCKERTPTMHPVLNQQPVDHQRSHVFV